MPITRATFRKVGGASSAPPFDLGRLPEDVSLEILSLLDPISLLEMARIDTRTRALCQSPWVVERVLGVPKRQATTQRDPGVGVSKAPWGQIVVRAGLQRLAAKVHRPPSYVLGLGHRFDKVHLSSDERWLWAEDGEGQGTLLDLARNAKAIKLSGGHCVFSADGRYGCTVQNESRMGFLADLRSFTVTQYPFKLTGTQGERAPRLEFSGRAEWLIQTWPSRNVYLVKDVLTKNQHMPFAAQDYSSWIHPMTLGRFALETDEDFSPTKALLHDADNPEQVIDLRPTWPHKAAEPPFDAVLLHDRWLLAKSGERFSYTSNRFWLARADSQPIQWAAVPAMSATGSSAERWRTLVSPEFGFLIAYKKYGHPQSIDCNHPDLPGTPLPDWQIGNQVPQGEYSSFTTRDGLATFSWHDGRYLAYGVDATGRLQQKLAFAPLPRPGYVPHPILPDSLVGHTSVERMLGDELFLVGKILQGRSGLPVPYLGTGNPRASRLLVLSLREPDRVLHDFAHSEDWDSETWLSEPQQLFAQKIARYREQWNGPSSPDIFHIWQLGGETALPGPLLTLPENTPFLGFFEAGKALLVRRKSDELSFLPMGRGQNPKRDKPGPLRALRRLVAKKS